MPIRVRLCVCAWRKEEWECGKEFIEFTHCVIPNKHSLQSLQSNLTVNVCRHHTLSRSHFQTPWWNRARTRVSVTRLKAAALEPRWNVVSVMTVTGPTGATATGTTTTTVQGLWPPAPSCWSRPCWCAWPSVSCEHLHFSFLPVIHHLLLICFILSFAILSIHPPPPLCHCAPQRFLVDLKKDLSGREFQVV